MKLHVVTARTGLTWVRMGLRTFWRQPLALAGLFFMFMATASILSIVPVLGSVAALALVPAVTVALMAATREAHEGRFPMPSLLLTAFRASPERTRSMLMLGGAYAAALMLVMGAAALVGGTEATLPAAGGDADQVRNALASPGMLLVMLLYLPVLLAFWHAPALVHWNGISPAKSLFFSLLACWANKGAMLVYMAGWLGVFVISALVLSLLMALLGGTAMNLLLYPAVLVMASVFHTSVYFTYRDSFLTDESEPPTSPPGDTP